jgi:hypothetical protein
VDGALFEIHELLGMTDDAGVAACVTRVGARRGVTGGDRRHRRVAEISSIAPLPTDCLLFQLAGNQTDLYFRVVHRAASPRRGRTPAAARRGWRREQHFVRPEA